MRFISDFINPKIARIVKTLGFKPHWSTFIDGSYTCGYGKCGNDGWWTYPLIKEAEEREKAHYDSPTDGAKL